MHPFRRSNPACPPSPPHRGPLAVPQLPGRLPSPNRPAKTCIPSEGGGADTGGPWGGSGLQVGDVTYQLGIDPLQLQAALQGFVESGVSIRTRPSPIDAIPFRGTIPPLFARAVIAPAAAPGDADGAAAAAAMAAAESSFGGDTVQVLTPATTTAGVTVLTFTPPTGNAFVMRGVGVWGHDLRAIRDLIRWRVSIGQRIVSEERELGMIGSLDSPALIFGVAREGQTITVEARNLDPLAPSLVEVAVFGWLFPVDGAAADNLQAITDPRG